MTLTILTRIAFGLVVANLMIHLAAPPDRLAFGLLIVANGVLLLVLRAYRKIAAREYTAAVTRGGDTLDALLSDDGDDDRRASQ